MLGMSKFVLSMSKYARMITTNVQTACGRNWTYHGELPRLLRDRL